jgi:hypothetical protein
VKEVATPVSLSTERLRDLERKYVPDGLKHMQHICADGKACALLFKHPNLAALYKVIGRACQCALLCNQHQQYIQAYALKICALDGWLQLAFAEESVDRLELASQSACLPAEVHTKLAHFLEVCTSFVGLELTRVTYIEATQELNHAAMEQVTNSLRPEWLKVETAFQEVQATLQPLHRCTSIPDLLEGHQELELHLALIAV